MLQAGMEICFWRPGGRCNHMPDWRESFVIKEIDFGRNTNASPILANFTGEPVNSKSCGGIRMSTGDFLSATHYIFTGNSKSLNPGKCPDEFWYKLDIVFHL
jgi:hypothetical protein